MSAVDTLDPQARAAAPVRSGWSWRTYWAALTVLSLLLGLWGLATPRFAVPDEPAHFLKAAAVVRGQLIGLPERPTRFGLPPAIADTRFQTGCFVFLPEVPADCPPGQGGSGTGPGDVVAYTAAGKYPPAYYALVGLPTLVWPDLRAVHAARGVSAALSAALLAAAVTAAAIGRHRVAGLAIGVAVTPMVLFVASGLNPSGPEIAAAAALWASGAALALGTGPPARPLVGTLGVSAVVVALSRPISPFWVALIGVALLLLAGWRRVVELLRVRGVQVAVAAVVLACAAQATWILTSASLELYGAGRRVPLLERLRTSAGLTDERLRQLVGWFGWLDTPPPLAVHLAWAAVLLVVVVVAVRRSRPRAVAVAGLLAVGVLVVPVVLEARSISDVGYFWQGRYTLPLAVGVPLVLAAGSRASARRPLLALLLTVVAACHLVVYVVALGRYTVGTGNGLGLVDEQWAPPLPALVLAAAFAAVLLGWSAVLFRCGGQPNGGADSGPDAAAASGDGTSDRRSASGRPGPPGA